VDTSGVGSGRFVVDPSDNVGNRTSLGVPYAVRYDVCPLYDQNRAVKTGATVPIRLELCDAAGNDVSSAGVTVTTTDPSLVSGTAAGALDVGSTANPDGDFRFDSSLGQAGGYIFNLSTKGLATGTYRLSFGAGADPTRHDVSFQVR
jgi:hypothetical protein